MGRHSFRRTRRMRDVVPLSLALTAILAVTMIAVPAFGDHDDGDSNPATTTWLEEPEQVGGNDSESCEAGDEFFRINGGDPNDEGQSGSDLISGTYTDPETGAQIILTIPSVDAAEHGQDKTLDFEVVGGSAAEVRVKGGPNGHNVYDYVNHSDGDTGDPGQELATGTVGSDTFLHSPPGPQPGTFGGLSHISFCYDVIGFLQVEKFIDVDADGILDVGDVTSDDGTGNLAGWEFEVYEGSDTSGTLVDTLVTDSNGDAGPIALAAGTYTVLESNTGKTITTDVTGGSLTEITTENPVTDGVVSGETTTYTFGNACLITKVFQVTGVPAGTTGLQARYDSDLDDEVSGADVVTVALSDQGSGVHSGTATELFQIGDALEWEYVHTGTGSSEFVGSETFGLDDGYPSCLRTNTVEFAPPTVTVNKFKDILADGLTEDDTQGLANWQFNLWLDGGDGVFGGDDTFIETLTTGADGSATNTVQLAPGDYHVEELLQPNWVNTTPGGDPAVIPVTLDIGEDETVNFANAPEARFDVRFFDLTGFTDATIDCDTDGTDTHNESATPETIFESDNVTVGTYTCTIVIVDP